MSRLVRLAADLVALHLLTYPRGSKIGFGITQPCSRNQRWIEIEREEVDKECNWALVRATV